MSSAPYPATEHQLEVLRFIAGYIETHGYSPTYAEIGKAVGQKSKGRIHECISALEERGHLRRLGRGLERAIEVLHKPALPRGPKGEPMHFVRVAEPA